MSALFKQVLAVAVLGQLLFATGMNYGLNSVTLLQLPGEGLLSRQQLVWTLVVTTLGALAGCLLAAPLAPVLGLRKLLLMACPLSALGSLACALADGFWWLLFGRALMQVSLGMTEGTVRGYVAEIAPTRLRAVYATALNCLIFAGQISVLGLGAALHWRPVFLVTGCGPAAVCLAGALLFLPNSPNWLLARGRPEHEAARALRFYRSRDADVWADVKLIGQSLRETESAAEAEAGDGAGHGAGAGTRGGGWRLLLGRQTLLPLTLASLQMTLFVWCGGSTLVQVTAYVLAPLRLSVSGYYTAMLPPAVSLVAATSASPLLERCGRRPALQLGGLLTATGASILASYFLLPAHVQSASGWLVLAGAVLIQIGYSAFIGPVTFNYCTELLPDRTRTLAANVVMSVLNVNISLLLLAYPAMAEAVGHGGAFLLHAAVGVVQVALARWCLPETRGLSLQQIQCLFQPAPRKVPSVVDARDSAKHRAQSLAPRKLPPAMVNATDSTTHQAQSTTQRKLPPGMDAADSTTHQAQLPAQRKLQPVVDAADSAMHQAQSPARRKLPPAVDAADSATHQVQAESGAGPQQAEALP